VGQHQAKLYADCLEAQFGQRPVIFYSNGYDHWIWDDTRYPPRRVQGFYKKDELDLLIRRRATRRPLAEAKINPDIAERYYQTRAIRRIAESFERDHDRKVLLVMATGAGKTRTVIALADLLMRCNWVKHVLFLADRVALVNQAVNAFKRHLPDASPVNLVTEKHVEGRVYVSTYPTMMGLIDEAADGQRRFGVGHFDLIVIDEAHRSVFQKYGAILDYFDSLLRRDLRRMRQHRGVERQPRIGTFNTPVSTRQPIANMKQFAHGRDGIGFRHRSMAVHRAVAQRHDHPCLVEHRFARRLLESGLVDQRRKIVLIRQP